ncbi:MAG: hypothetical protein AB1742_00735 [bacterium]
MRLLDTKTGQIKTVLDGRDVSTPSISWDGKKLAFREYIKEGKNTGNEAAAADVKHAGEKKPPETFLKVLNLESGFENEIIIIAQVKDERPMWSKDGEYLFIPGISNVAYTIECDRKCAVAEYAKKMREENKNRDDGDAVKSEQIPEDPVLIYSIDTEEAEKKGLCRTVRGTIPEGERDSLGKVYLDDVHTWYTLHKYYSGMGITVRLLDHVTYFSLNPETEQILAKRLESPVSERKGLWLVDYSGREIREVKYEYVTGFDAVNRFGMTVGVASDKHGSVPVTLDTVTDEERPLIGKKQDLLTLAGYNFDQKRYKKAKELFEKYVSLYDLPEESGYRLIMIATYRETKDYEKMMKLTRTVPVEEIQRYFSVCGKF